MEISQIITIGIMGTVLALMLKKENPQISLMIALATGILIFLMLVTPLGEIFALLRQVAEKAGVSSDYFAIILKVIGIAYLAQFGAQVCSDAGEGAIAAKIELAGKVMIMGVSVPVLSGLLDIVMGLGLS